MLKFVVTRRKENQSFSSEVSSDSKTDINNNNDNNNNNSDDILPRTATSLTTTTTSTTSTTTTTTLTTDNYRPSVRSKKKKRLAETRHAIIFRQQKYRSLSIGGSVKSESEDEGANNSIHAWSTCSTPRLVSRWNNPSVDVDDFEGPEDDLPPFQRYFRAATGETPEPSKSSPITILIDKCPELSDSNLTLNGKHMSCSSFDTCISSATSSNDLSNQSTSSSVVCFGSSSSKIIHLELRKRPNCKKFGFTVVGGVDSPRGPMGIYVKTVHEDGLAAGLLQKGDELTSVNGKELKDMKHSAAVSLIKSSGKEGCLSLTLKRFQRPVNSRCDSYDEGIVSSSTQNSPTIFSESNLSAITTRLNQLASKLEEDASPSFISSSFDPTFCFQLSSHSDGTLKSTAHCSSSDCHGNRSDNHDNDDDDDNSDPTLHLRSTQLMHPINLELRDDRDACCSNSNNSNDNNSNNNNNNNRSLSRLMTRAAYDFGDKYSYSVLDRLKLEQVFIFDC